MLSQARAGGLAVTSEARAVAALVVAAGLSSSAAARAADPTTADCLAAAEASLNFRNDHRLRAERAQDLICGAASCPADIRDECTRRLDMVNAAIPTIVFQVKDAAGNDLSAVRVTMDNDVLAERLEGTALSIDPGAHAFSFETAGQPKLERQFIIVEGQKDRRELIEFGLSCGAGRVWSESSRQCVPKTRPPSGPSPLQIAGIATMAAGVASAGVGAWFGVTMLTKRDEARRACPGACASQAGVQLWRDAVSNGNVATALFIAGGAGVAGGAILWWAGIPAPASDPTVTVGLGPASAFVKGRW